MLGERLLIRPVVGSIPRFRRPENPSPPATTSTRSRTLIVRWGISRTKLPTPTGAFSKTTRLPSVVGHLGRLILVQDPHHALDPSVRRMASNLTDPRKTCEMVDPCLSTSTPNSVPRSVDDGGGSADGKQRMSDE